jgi:hypothetical protein
MLFNYANVKALWEASLLHGEVTSPGTSRSPPVLGVSGGEDIGGSGGDVMDFLTPGGGTMSVVDSVEMFSEDEKAKRNAVKLVPPLHTGKEE